MNQKFTKCIQIDSLAIKKFWLEQSTEWEMLRENLEGTKNAKVKVFEKDGFAIKLQHNQKRIVSTTAKTDESSINARKCFLCTENLYAEQRGIVWKGKFVFLCNPFPIFMEHFVISSLPHKPQKIEQNIDAFLEICRIFSPDFTLFYNGPKCGASAPDHLHFQAGIRNFMPIDEEIDRMVDENCLICTIETVEIFGLQSFGRKFFYFKSTEPSLMEKILQKIIKALLGEKQEEPMMNILASFINGEYRLIVFPRRVHRPWQYFAEGDKQILISPASVDFGGVFIAPRSEDFERLTLEDLANIYSQTSISEIDFSAIIDALKGNL